MLGPIESSVFLRSSENRNSIPFQNFRIKIGNNSVCQCEYYTFQLSNQEFIKFVFWIEVKLDTYNNQNCQQMTVWSTSLSLNCVPLSIVFKLFLIPI